VLAHFHSFLCFPFPQEVLPDGARLVLLATPLALYVARGPPGACTLEAAFAPYAAVRCRQYIGCAGTFYWQ
jgi:hypothetical protein